MSKREYREKCLSQKINACHTCGAADDGLVVHHTDGDETNDDLNNLIPMCRSCHSRLHTSKGLEGPLAELQENLPDSALSYTDTPSERERGNATARIPVKPSTKEMIDRAKPRGMTYDYWLQKRLESDGD